MEENLLAFLKNENLRLNRQAGTDWLTGLCNRMAMEEKVNRRLRTNGMGVLFVLDIDNFKKINDRYGHLAGDQVLRGVGPILKEVVFGYDIIGRVGGDEFVIFMSVDPDSDFIDKR